MVTRAAALQPANRVISAMSLDSLLNVPPDTAASLVT